MPLNGIKAEQLAYWYFRLNGYFTIRDFVVHPDLGTGQQTDIDVFGVRFPHRSELLNKSMKDDEFLVENKIHVVMVEVKASECSLNDTWKDKNNGNIKRFLNAVGAVPADKVDRVVECIYNKGIYEEDNLIIEIILVGKNFNEKMDKEFPEIDQILFDNILKFIYWRFKEYHLQKKLHDQWDNFGKELWRNFEESNSVEEFVQKYLD